MVHPSDSLTEPEPIVASLPFTAPTSFAQQRLWFLSQLEPNNPFYNIPLALRLTGALDVAALHAALQEIVRRHETLRTTYALDGTEPVQHIQPCVPLQVQYVSLERVPAAQQETRLRELIHVQAHSTFDLNNLPLRVTLVRLNATAHVLVLVLHHIAFDGWSRQVLERELAALYRAHTQAVPSPLAELPIQYADYAAWQREWLTAATLERELTPYLEALAGAPLVLTLPSDHLRPDAASYRGAHEPFTLDASLIETLSALSRAHNVTLSMMLLASFYVLIFRYTGQSDLLVGLISANRNRREIEGLIGFFVNTLVVRAQPQAEQTFAAFLETVRGAALEVFARQDVPFEKLVEALNPERSLAYAPLVQVAFNFMAAGAHADEDVDLGAVRGQWIPPDSDTTKFDLALNLQHSIQGTGGDVEYSTDLFERATIVRLLGHWQTLLRGIAADVNTSLGMLPLLTAHETAIFAVWNRTDAPYPQQTISALFEAQAARTPDALAVYDDTVRWTYAELNAQANRLAHSLRARGVANETRVGVALERSPRLIAVLLAILKAGGAYVPLDPHYPREHTAFVLADAAPRFVLTDTRHRATIGETNAPFLYLDELTAAMDQESAESPAHETLPDALVVVLYTSGSSGQPKGVMGTQGGVVNRCAWMWDTFPFQAGEVCCQKTSLNFVDAVWEIFGPLLRGVPLYVIADDTVREPHHLLAVLARENVTRLVLVPTLLRMLLDTGERFAERLPHLKMWTSSGEALSAALARAFYDCAPHATLLNLYGMSEAAGDSTAYVVPREISKAVLPIGKPIANTQTYVLDAQGQRVPVGVVGELYIGGDGLARGYWQRAELTREKFTLHPEWGRLYRTGDLGRYYADGNLEWVGRTDDQIKIRGMRVELNEIDRALATHPCVQQAVVTRNSNHTAPVAQPVVTGESRLKSGGELVAHIVSDGALPEAELRAYAKSKLPAHMLPQSYVFHERLPTLAGGKTDRRALAQMGLRDAPQVRVTVLHDETERRMVGLWERVLAVPQVGVTDDFFARGGHSLLALRLFAEIENEFGTRLPIATLFTAPTVAELARAVRKPVAKRAWSPLVPIQPAGTRTPLYFVHSLGGDVTGYMPLARALGDDQPFYGFEARGYDGTQPPDDSIVTMAARYVTALKQHQPRGPYHLGGYCFGGTVAFEMARQLEAAGDTVGLVAGIETIAPTSGYLQPHLQWRVVRGMVGNLPLALADFARLGWGVQTAYLRRAFKNVWYYRIRRLTPLERQGIDQQVADQLERAEPLPQGQDRMVRAHLRTLWEYRPQSYAGTMTIFLAARPPLFCSYDPLLGWGTFARQVKTARVGGGHASIMREPHVARLAAAVQREKASLVLGASRENS